MTPEELEASLRRIRFSFYEIQDFEPNALLALEEMTKVISFLVAENSLLNSRLDEMQSRLSTLEHGSTKPEESPSLTGRRVIFQAPQYLS